MRGALRRFSRLSWGPGVSRKKGREEQQEPASRPWWRRLFGGVGGKIRPTTCAVVWAVTAVIVMLAVALIWRFAVGQ
jgi:hypothetical protein